jgi:Tfp pilus assembly protein PilN
MAIQLNLLPDVKTRYIKSEKTRRLAILISIIVTGVCVGVIVVFLAVLGGQKIALNKADDQINKKSTELKNVANITNMLTVQAQLNSLNTLHGQKTVNSRLFGYMAQLTPASVQIAELSLNQKDSTATVTGSADTLESVNKFTDTLKFAQFQTTGNTQLQTAFSNVTLTTFARDDKGASYGIGFSFDPELFSIGSQGVQLKAKEGVTTRAQNPTALFKAPEAVK